MSLPHFYLFFGMRSLWRFGILAIGVGFVFLSAPLPVKASEIPCPASLTIHISKCQPGACATATPAGGDCQILGRYCSTNSNDDVCKNSGVTCQQGSTLPFCVGMETGKSVAQGRGRSFVFLGLDFEAADKCLSCSLVEMLVNTSFTLGGRAYEALRTGVSGLLAAIFGIYILIQAGKLLLPFGPLENVAGTLNAVASRTFVIIGVLSLLMSFRNYWETIHTPPLVTAINLTSTLMDRVYQNMIGSAVLLTTCPQLDSSDVAGIATAMSCTMRNAQTTVQKGMQSGVAVMMEVSRPNWNPVTWPSAAAGFIIGLASAGILLLIYAPVYLSLPLKMADIIVRWTLLAVLSPLLIAAAAFPATRSFLIAGIKGIFHAAFELMMYGVVVALGAYAMNTVVTSLADGDVIYAPLINTAIFWQLLLIGLILDTMLAKCRSVAISLTDPTPNPSGMHSGGIEELGQRAAGNIISTGTKAVKSAENIWKSRRS